MRYELTDYEWTSIKPMLPNKPRGVPRVDDRRVLNGIFWVLRSGAPWRDLPDAFGPYTTCYNRFVRWRRAGVWSRIMDALAAAHDASVQMIDTSIVRVHQARGLHHPQPQTASALAAEVTIIETYDKGLIRKSGKIKDIIIREPPPRKQPGLPLAGGGPNAKPKKTEAPKTGR